MTWKRAALVLALSAFTLFAAECAYRVKVARQTAAWDRPINYRMTPSVYVEFDERHGERFKPNRDFWVSYVQDGRLIWGSVISRSNRDGLGGRTTIAEYERAPVKVLVFGDSFTHWNQGGVTWPDLLQGNLRRTLGRDVAVLNYARGTYGVLQMLDLAADVASERRPDLVVVALIGNEGPDPVLESAHAQFRGIRDEVESVRRGFRPWALDRSYLLRRLTRGHPFEAAPMLIPQVDFDDYGKDARTVDNLRRLKALGVPVLFVYLPTALEMEHRECLLDRRSQRLMQSLERLAGRNVRLIQREHKGRIPEKMDLLPIDNHPNPAGLRLFADAIAPMVVQEIAQPKDRRTRR